MEGTKRITRCWPDFARGADLCVGSLVADRNRSCTVSAWELKLVNVGYVCKADGQAIAADLDRIIGNCHNPENTIRRDTRIEVVELYVKP